MKRYRNILIVPILAFCVFFGACSESTTTSPAAPYESGECYDAPGCVIAVFDKNVTDDAIRDFISGLGLATMGDISGVAEKWALIAVPEGTEDEWVVTLMEYEIVVTAERDKICPVHE